MGWIEDVTAVLYGKEPRLNNNETLFRSNNFTIRNDAPVLQYNTTLYPEDEATSVGV